MIQTRDATYFSAERLGANTHLTNEGYLLCVGVPIARTGPQLYTNDDLPHIEANSGGEIVVDRLDDDVFRPETIASFNGKPVTINHPMDSDPTEVGWDVNPDNVGEYEVGVVLNPRRGEGEDSDKILADLMIKRRDAIDEVQGGKRQVSCGYDAQYEPISAGHARQRNIVGNHVALVDLARCGPSCSIRDGETTMTATTTRTNGGSDRWKRFMDSLNSTVAGFRDELVSSEGGTGVHTHIHLPQAGEGVKTAAPGGDAEDPLAALTKRVDGIENAVRDGFKKFTDSALKAIAQRLRDAEKEGDDDEDDDDKKTGDAFGEDPDDKDKDRTKDKGATLLMDDPEPSATGNKGGGLRSAEATPVARDRARRTGDGGRVTVRDSAHLEDRYEDLVSRAEILIPGFRFPTFDSRAPATRTIDAMCGLRRRVIVSAWKTEDGRAAIEPIAGWTRDDVSQPVRAMSCDAVTALFNGASHAARVANGGYTIVNQRGPGGGAGGARDARPMTLGDLNKRNRDFFNPSKQQVAR